MIFVSMREKYILFKGICFLIINFSSTRVSDVLRRLQEVNVLYIIVFYFFITPFSKIIHDS